MKPLFRKHLLFLGLAFLMCFGLTAFSYGQAVVSVAPPEVGLPAVGGQVTISLKITNARNVAAYRLTVNFDTSVLRYVSSANGGYLPMGEFFAPPQALGEKVTLAAISGSGDVRAGSGTLASVTFSVISRKKSTIQLTDVMLADSSANSLPVQTRNGSVVEGDVPLKHDVNRDGQVDENGSVVEGDVPLKHDVNRDGQVNQRDIQFVRRAMIFSLKNPKFYAAAGFDFDVNGDGHRDTVDDFDMNGDGSLDGLDLISVVQHQGETTGDGPPPPPPSDDGTTNPLPPLSPLPDDDATDGGTTNPPSPPPPSPLPSDGMVLIPTGEFEMGSNDDNPNEKPIRSVYVDAFYMDKYEVTNADYAVFLNKKGKHSEGGIVWYDAGSVDARIERVGGRYEVRTGYETHPVTEVSWYGALAYALSVGKRLPTEAEWEYAARGGLIGATYPWGNAAPDANRLNFYKNVGDTTAVGKYRENGYGLYDMAGNVYEWCLDEYDADFYSVSPARNPLSGARSIQWLLDNYTEVKTHRVLRGGSWINSTQNVRVAYRINDVPPAGTYFTVGFRCARAVTP